MLMVHKEASLFCIRTVYNLTLSHEGEGCCNPYCPKSEGVAVTITKFPN